MRRTHLRGLVVDNKDGIGATPNNANIDYLGLRVQMRPSVFLRLARHLPKDARRVRSIDYLRQAIREGRGVGAPSLYIDIPAEEWDQTRFPDTFAKVTGHEGRHRATVAFDLFFDEPIEVHLFPYRLRRRHLELPWIRAISDGMISEDGDLVRGPLFTEYR
jgi:hypothetical protein